MQETRMKWALLARRTFRILVVQTFDFIWTIFVAQNLSTISKIRPPPR
jgi:hypothetical protein